MKYIYYINIEDMEDEVFHLLDKLDWINEENYEGNGWMMLELSKEDAKMLEWLSRELDFTIAEDY